MDTHTNTHTPSVRLKVQGMHCASCVSRIETTLHSRFPALDAVHVNLTEGEALFRGNVPPKDVIAALGEIGYPASEISAQSPAAAEEEDTRLPWQPALAVLLTLPLLGMHLGIGMLSGPVQWAIATPVVVLGAGFFKNALARARHLQADMDTLVALGVGTAYIYSALQVLKHAPVHTLYFESAAIITAVILIGRHLEARARKNTGRAIRSLIALQPQTAHRFIGGDDQNTIEDIPADQIQIGDKLLLKPGETIPADGEVIEGQGAVNESLISGESRPLIKTPGSMLMGGSVNLDGSLIMRATQVGGETVLARIIRLVETARNTRPPIQRLADQLAGVFVPVVIVLALLTYLGWMLVAHHSPHAIACAVAVLVVACPCALGLATPAAIQVAVGQGALHGILIRNVETLERACQLSTLVFDKTGTLTTGKPMVRHFFRRSRYTDDEVISLIAALESRSEHPAAHAIAAFAASRNVSTGHPVSDVIVTGGAGISGNVTLTQPEVRQYKVLIGTREYLETHGIKTDVLNSRAEHFSQQNLTPLWFALDGDLAGLVGIGDEPRPEAAETIKRIKAMGITPVLLTGDQEPIAKEVALQCGIVDFYAAQSPQDKQAFIKNRQAEKHLVGMAGDGINDAAALAQADIGIALGTGTAVAMETADLTLTEGGIGRIVAAIQLSRTTVRIIRQNLFWALFYNILCIPAAALGVLSPGIAAIAMSLSSICVVVNAMRIRVQ